MSAAAPTTPTAYAHIVRTLGTVGGEPRIEGTRIRVSDIVARQREGRSPSEIASDRCYPHLSLAQVYSALAYYEDHRDEIEGYFLASAELAERVKRDNPLLVRDLRSPSAAEFPRRHPA